MLTESITAGSFQSKCMKLIDKIQEKQISVIITKRGKPIAKLVPIEDPTSVTINNDIIAPIDEDWNADKY